MSVLYEDKKWIDYVLRNADSFSKCVRAKYLSVIIDKYGRLVGSGWNGKPAKAINDDICYREGFGNNTKRDEVCCIHSEKNCLLNTNRQDRFGSTMFVSGVPCSICMLEILNTSLARLVYFDGESTSGHKGDGEALWKRYGIEMDVVPFNYSEWERLWG